MHAYENSPEHATEFVAASQQRDVFALLLQISTILSSCWRRIGCRLERRRAARGTPPRGDLLPGAPSRLEMARPFVQRTGEMRPRLSRRRLKTGGRSIRRIRRFARAVALAIQANRIGETLSSPRLTAISRWGAGPHHFSPRPIGGDRTGRGREIQPPDAEERRLRRRPFSTQPPATAAERARRLYVRFRASRRSAERLSWAQS